MKDWRKFVRTQVMDYVEAHGTVRRKDIIRFIKMCNGHHYSNPTSERGYWGCQFSSTQNALLVEPRPYDPRWLERDGHGSYHVAYA